MTPAKPPGGKPDTARGAMPIDRFGGIIRT
jgi:hypothetical protein